MGNARYRVRLRDSKRFMEIVTVWAEGETVAINEVKRWFEVQHDLGQVWVEEEAELIGPNADPGDLGVAESNEAVNNQSFTWDGKILSTKFRVEPEHLRRSTRLMRESDRPAWQLLRERLRERGSILRTRPSPTSQCTSPILRTRCGSRSAGSGAPSCPTPRYLTHFTT